MDKSDILLYLEEHGQLPLSSLESRFKDKELLSKIILELIEEDKIKVKNRMVPMIRAKYFRKSPQKKLNSFVGKKEKKPAKLKIKSKVYPMIKDELKPKKEAPKKQEIMGEYDRFLKRVIQMDQREGFQERKDMPFAKRQKSFSHDPDVEKKVKKLLKNVGFA